MESRLHVVRWKQVQTLNARVAILTQSRGNFKGNLIAVLLYFKGTNILLFSKLMQH